MLFVTNSLKFRESASDPFQKLSLSANLDAIAMPTIVNESTTVSANVTDATYTVSGAGVVVVFAGVVNDSDDYGEWAARIYHNGSLVMGEGTRWATSSTEYFGASTSVPLAVANGDTIRIYLKNTKGGSNKLIFRRFLCFGCTVS